MATMINLKISSSSVPYTSADFLGYGDREQRVRDKQVSDLRTQKLNQQLTMAMPRAQRRGDPEPDNLPLWARKNPTVPGGSVLDPKPPMGGSVWSPKATPRQSPTIQAEC